MTSFPDMVNRPPHYQGERFESIDVIEACRLGFHLGNAFKYIARHKKKGGRQDLDKAHWYLKRFNENMLMRLAQNRAWATAFTPSLAGVTSQEVALDFGLDGVPAKALVLILQAARSKDGTSPLVHEAEAILRRHLDDVASSV